MCNWNTFGNIDSNLEWAEEQMMLQQSLYDQYGEEELWCSSNVPKVEYAWILAVQQGFWHQKASIKWIQQGDANMA